jgi:hypothetical protein
MKTIIASLTFGACLLFSAAGPTFAGQPGASCQQTNPILSTPGHAGDASNTGSPFSPNGISGTRYAGSAPQNSNNPKSVSQYDIACVNFSASSSSQLP